MTPSISRQEDKKTRTRQNTKFVNQLTNWSCAIRGLDFRTASCALLTRAAATKRMASVIRLVCLIDLILSRRSRVLPSITTVLLLMSVRALWLGTKATTLHITVKTTARMKICCMIQFCLFCSLHLTMLKRECMSCYKELVIYWFEVFFNANISWNSTL